MPPKSGPAPATIITEDVLNKLFAQPGKFTSQAKFWNDVNLPTRESIFIDGNVKVQIGNQINHFSEGAIVSKDPVKGFYALPERSRWGGGVTAGGGPLEPMSKPFYSWDRPKGNFATLRAEEGFLRLALPDGRAGFSIAYPGHTPEQLVAAARQQKAIIELKDSAGDTIKGFFVRGRFGQDGIGKGGVFPHEFDHYSNPHHSPKPGEFVTFREYTNPKNGEVSRTTLFKYQSYTEAEAARGYGNDIKQLKMPNGEKINLAKLPHLNVEMVPVEPNYLRALELSKASEPKIASPRAVDTKIVTTEPIGARTPETKISIPKAADTKIGPAELSGTSKNLNTVGKYLGPAFLAIGPVLQSGADAYETYKNNGDTGDIASSALLGAGKGAIDTFLPGARDGYASVIGNKKLTFLDRTLNALSDFSGTATAIGSTAMIAEAAGVVSLPAVIPTGIATGVAGLTNIGVNVVKAAVKASGLAGEDQDGGYVYDLSRLGGYGASQLYQSVFGAEGKAASKIPAITDTVRTEDIEHLIREARIGSTPEGRPAGEGAIR